MSFITVEDTNTVNLKPVHDYHTIDTSKISLDEFENVFYDFCSVSHSISGNTHVFEFIIQNSLWTGGYRVRRDGETITTTTSYDSSSSTLSVSFTSSDPTDGHIELELYLCSFKDATSLNQIYARLVDSPIIYVNRDFELGSIVRIDYRNQYGAEVWADVQIDNFGLTKTVISDTNVFILVLVEKTGLVFDLTGTVTVGKLNHVPLSIDSHYLPTGDLVDGAELDIVINYNGTLITAEYDSSINDYCFDLDLRDKINDTPVNLTVLVNESEYVSPSVHNVVLGCTYPSASSFNELTSLIVSGAVTIKLTSDIVFTGNLDLTHPLHLICDDNTVNLSSYSISVKETSFTVDNGNFINGTPAIIQDKDSKVTCNNCSFSNASITDEYKGSVISTLPYENIVTIMRGCSILNCHHSIYHQGTLTIINMNATYNDFNDSIDTDYSAFLTMYQGTCDITQSSFNIYYPDLCTDEIDVKFAESLVGLGENVLFNNSLASNLNKHNSLPFFLNYNNQSSIYCRYYYSELEECLVTQAVTGSENKAVCHTILGNPTIYKNNVTVTRATEED